jgi:hypothetical protein
MLEILNPAEFLFFVFNALKYVIVESVKFNLNPTVTTFSRENNL